MGKIEKRLNIVFPGLTDLNQRKKILKNRMMFLHRNEILNSLIIQSNIRTIPFTSILLKISDLFV